MEQWAEGNRWARMIDTSASARPATTYYNVHAVRHISTVSNLSYCNAEYGRTLVVAQPALTSALIPPALDIKSCEVSSLFHSFAVVGGLLGGVIPW